MRRYALTLTMLCACSFELSNDLDIDGSFGADPGGVQDIGHAREVIANGDIPTAQDFPIEGLLSEHDIPVEGAPCEDLLCVRPASGFVTSLRTGAPEQWIQLGMTSGLPADWQRPPVDLVFVIDRSSSMSIDMVETLNGVASAIQQLRPDDRVGVVAFDAQPKVVTPLQYATDVEAIVRDLYRLKANGGWDPMPAMTLALDMHRELEDDPTRLRRISLLSCSYPSVTTDSRDPFTSLATAAAAQRIGISVYGVLLGFDPSLGDLLGDTRGGSLAYLDTLERVEQVFSTDFDLMISPLAYDLRMELRLAEGVELTGLYGMPGADDVDLHVATLFPSRGDGAVLARVSTPEGSATGEVALSYEAEPAHGWSGRTEATEPILTVETPYGVRKGAALVQTAEQMATACDAWWSGDREFAIAQVEELIAWLGQEVDALQDDGLQQELALAEQLRENMTR